MPSALDPSLHAALAGYRTAFDMGAPIEAVARTILTKLANQRPSTIANADGEIAYVAGLNGWEQKPTFLQRLFLRRMSEVELLIGNNDLKYLYIFHRNGRIREQALDRIHGPLPNEFLVAAICWRLNDWAHQVRASARRCAERCFRHTSPVILAKFFLGTLRHLITWRRWSEVELDHIWTQLRRQDVISELARLFLTEREGPLPSTFSNVIRYPEFDLHLKQLAVVAIHPAIRAVASRALINGKVTFADGIEWRWIDKSMGIRRKQPVLKSRDIDIEVDRKALIRFGLQDKSAMVRRVAVSGIIAHELHATEFIESAHQLLSDRSPSVRSRAENILKMAGEAPGEQIRPRQAASQHTKDVG